jgi:hypothetical protein
MRIFSIILLLSTAACGPKKAPTTAPTESTDSANKLAEVHELGSIQAITCSKDTCDIETASGHKRLQIKTMEFSEQSPPNAPLASPWPVATSQSDLNTVWNTQVANQWRSPFQVSIPAPGGGFYRSSRGVGSSPSRIVRLGGSVVTARQGLSSERLSYPRNLALHPTGTEAYHIVWPNPDLIAFNARTLETTWRIRLDGPALGLFVSANGRYLLAELDGEPSDGQLLDYDPQTRQPPDRTDPWANPVLQWIKRPEAKRTVLIDLALGEPVAIVPGQAVGLILLPDGALVAGRDGVAKVITKDR